MRKYCSPADVKIGELGLDNGYQYFLDRRHPMCNNNCGRVYLHRHLAALKLGRWLLSSEHVHHIDGDRSNNAESNLAVMTHAEHNRLHHPAVSPIRCIECGDSFVPSHSRIKKGCCSSECSSKHRRKFDVGVDDLRELVWAVPSSVLAVRFGVSDASIAKRCRLLGIKKPPRGYWAKQHAALSPRASTPAKG